MTNLLQIIHSCFLLLFDTFGHRGQSNTSYMVLGTLYVPYIWYMLHFRLLTSHAHEL